MSLEKEEGELNLSQVPCVWKPHMSKATHMFCDAVDALYCKQPKFAVIVVYCDEFTRRVQGIGIFGECLSQSTCADGNRNRCDKGDHVATKHWGGGHEGDLPLPLPLPGSGGPGRRSGSPCQATLCRCLEKAKMPGPAGVTL